MSQERLDKTCRIPIGTRDAIHVPFVVARLAEKPLPFEAIQPGSFVRFTDAKFTQFVRCDKDVAHGIINPFLDDISPFDDVVVLLMPGITTAVRHHFDIDPNLREMNKASLAAELEEVKMEDSDCAGCWVIRNNEIIRN